MKVFLSWSGKQSQDAAEAIREWLPCVLQYARPFVSSEDLRKGGRWLVDLSRELEATRFGIMVLCPENLSSPWIHFEAGALTKSVEQSSACALLLGGLRPTDVVGPLAMFQHTLPTQEDFYRLLQSINQASAAAILESGHLRAVFDKFWPDLNARLLSLQAQRPNPSPSRRSDRELLEELLILARYSARHVRDDEHADEYVDYAKFGRLLYWPLANTDLSPKIVSALAAANVENIIQLVSLNRRSLSRTPGLTSEDVKAVACVVEQLGLRLGMEFPEGLFPKSL